MRNLLRRFSVKNRLRNLFFQLLRIKKKSPSGIEIRIKDFSDSFLYEEIFVNNEYDAAIEILLSGSRNTQPDIVLDIGANVGYFAIRVLDLWITRHGKKEFPYHIYCFEGVPSTYQRLTATIENSSIKNYITSHLGLIGLREGTGLINSHAISGASSTVNKLHYLKSIEIPYIDIMKTIPSDASIALLKCDIEGSEELFLENYADLLTKVENAVFELHPTLCNADRCIELLKSQGLHLKKVLRDEPDMRVLFFRRS